MSFEELDKKIKDAADKHQPSYNEKAWTKMEHLLDKDLPQKKDHKKRFIFWMIAFLISTPLLMIWLNRDLGGDKPVSKSGVENIREENQPINKPTVLQQQSTSNGNDRNISKMNNEGSDAVHQENIPAQNNLTATQTPTKEHATLNIKNVNQSTGIPFQSTSIPPITGNEILNNEIISHSFLQSPAEKLNTNNLFDQSILASFFNSDLRADIPSIIPPVKNDENVFGKKSFAQKLFIAVSAGPSVSSVGINNPGKVTPLYGGSIKYALTNKLTIGGGFFVNKKIYAAGKDDYRPPAGYWTYYTDLLRVDADCDVYEIPLTISYSIKKSGNHEWLASSGISSYFMKKETYDYEYKNQSGQVLNRSWSIEKKNMNHLAAITLSAGYRHHINQRTSILIEPNFKIPLKGVGYGKVKFYNAGTMVSLQVKPFAKK